MYSVIRRATEKCDHIVILIVLITMGFALRPVVVVAAEESPVQKQEESAKASDKFRLKISVDENKGVEIQGLEQLKKKLSGLKNLESLQGLENLKELENIEDEIESSLQGIDNIDVQVVSDINGKKVNKNKRKATTSLFKVSDWVAFAPFILFFAIVFLVLFFRFRSRKETLATIRLMVEKGEPVPESLLESLTGQNSSSIAGGAVDVAGNKSFLLSGLKPIFWGLGIILFFVFEHVNSEQWFIGMIFILVGLYHMTKSYLLKESVTQTPSKKTLSSDNNSNTDSN